MNSTNQPILQNNHSDIKVLQGVVSLESERLEEFNSKTGSTENYPKARVRRYSGAARRRYKKEQLQREKESAQTSLTEVVPNSKTGEGEALAVTSKRARQEFSTPSPTNIQSKRPNISDQESYEPKGSVTLSLPLEGYPDKSKAPAVTSKRAWPELSTPIPTDIQGKRPKISDQESYAPKGSVTLPLSLEDYPDKSKAPAVTSKRAWPELSTPSPTDIQVKRSKISDQESYAPKGSVTLPLPLEDYPDKSKAPAVTSKRAWPELSTPSPIDIQVKRSKISDQESYAPKDFVTLALTLEGYPDKRLGAGECSMTRKLIRERILELSEGTKAPTFSGSWERDGTLVFTCVDKQSGDWLKNLSSNLKLGENSLRVLSIDELPKRHRVVVHVKEPDMSAEEALKLLGKQNTGLAINDWIVIKESENRDATNTQFACLVRDPSLEALKTCNFRPFCGLGQATVRLLEKERKKDFESIKVTIKEEVI